MYQISVWFVCKLCGSSYQKVTQLINHKKEEHFNEFKNTRCIVFEERTLNINFVYEFPSASSQSDSEWEGSENRNADLKPVVIPTAEPPYTVQFQDQFQSDVTVPHSIKDRRSIDDSIDDSVQFLDDQNEFINNDSVQQQTNNDFTSEFEKSLSFENEIISDNDTKIDFDQCSTEETKSENLMEDLEFEVLEDISEIETMPEKEFSDKPNPYVLLKRLTTTEVKTASSRQKTESVTPLKSNPEAIDEVRNSYNVTEFESSSQIAINQSGDSIPVAYPKSEAIVDIAESVSCDVRTSSISDCQFCHDMFASTVELEAHLKTCLSKRQIDRHCALCDKTFSSTFSKKRHELKIHEASKVQRDLRSLSVIPIFKCEYCSKEFLSQLVLKYHILSHVNKTEKNRSTARRGSFRCTHVNCGKSYTRARNLRLHVKRVHAENVEHLQNLRKYDVNTKVFNTENAEHLRNLSKNDVNSQVFNTESAEHLQNLNKNDVKAQVFNTENAEHLQNLSRNDVNTQVLKINDSSFDIHPIVPQDWDSQSCSDSKPFKCLHQNCVEAFETVTALRCHLITHFNVEHTVDTEVGPQSESLKSGSDETTAKRKSNSHRKKTDSRRSYNGIFPCIIGGCDKTFTRADNMRRHIERAHTVLLSDDENEVNGGVDDYYPVAASAVDEDLHVRITQ